MGSSPACGCHAADELCAALDRMDFKPIRDTEIDRLARQHGAIVRWRHNTRAWWVMRRLTVGRREAQSDHPSHALGLNRSCLLPAP